MTCPDCQYLREERIGIHRFEGRATMADAVRWAVRDEFCPAHRPKEAGMVVDAATVAAARRFFELAN